MFETNVELWKERLPELCKGYKFKDIRNGYGWKCILVLPIKGLAKKGKKLKMIKSQSKGNCSFFVSAEGEKVESQL